MDRIRLTGGNPLNGEIPISGAKNAALPLMIASLLTDEPLVLTNVPRLTDIATLARLLAELGVEIEVLNSSGAWETLTTPIEGRLTLANEQARRLAGFGPDATYKPGGRTLRLTARTITSTHADYDLVSKMRASFWVLGPLLARCGHADVSLPGGCAIGTRPVDLHLQGMEKLGATIELDKGYVIAAAKDGLKGAEVRFSMPSVGATHNVLMAAVLADGVTRIENAAREPEITNLADCLNAMGAKIEGLGTSTLTVTGVERLHGAEVAVVCDRIEAGTYAMAAAMTGGDVTLSGVDASLFEAALQALTAAGVDVDVTPADSTIRIRRNGTALSPVDIVTQPYPAFPTDLQAQFMALMTMADGNAQMTETIFENRFMHVQELARLGALISLHGDRAIVSGVKSLRGAPVMATDLRASVSLVIAGLAAEGETVISRVYHLDRGFERLEDKLSACGADISRLPG
ncbi:UDP-N-acetylglucosamine 1-carboxyvinyltransferase [Pyruvatibacter mobilis]|uniref:UDP-N-acetylglucosamine 1-carboxyvinyltransferase n=1 Tax=Pyruvatibacter mobilis TaxID=1712261 RepID=UPI003BAB8A01